MLVFSVYAAQDEAMADLPKRKFWQFHLSTLIVATCLVGTLQGLNLRTREVTFKSAGLHVIIHGWPCNWYRWDISQRIKCQSAGLSAIYSEHFFDHNLLDALKSSTDIILTNALIGVVLILLGVIIVEFANRRFRRAHKL